MSFWAGFITGAAALWTLSTAAALTLAWYLNRVSNMPEVDYAAWGIEEPEEVEYDGPWPAAIAFTHTSNIGAQVKGGG